MSESEEDDYLSMVIQEPQTKQSETSIQRRKRKEREGEERARVKSKKELAAEAEKARNAGLATTLPASNKGFQLLAKLGYKPGDKLGAPTNPNALSEPVGLDVKEDRGGVGLDSEKKRKVREALTATESDAKRLKAEEGDFRERVARERDEKRKEGQWWGAMKVSEGFDEDEDASNPADRSISNLTSSDFNNRSNVHLESQDTEAVDPVKGNFPKDSSLQGQQHTGRLPNLLWRPLVHERAKHEREKHMRQELQQSLTRNATYDDPEEDRYDRIALNKEEVNIDLDADDPELDEYLAMPIAERLDKVVKHLRQRWQYCFWCKYRYPDEAMEDCPGETEEDHE